MRACLRVFMWDYEVGCPFMMKYHVQRKNKHLLHFLDIYVFKNGEYMGDIPY